MPRSEQHDVAKSKHLLTQLLSWFCSTFSVRGFSDDDQDATLPQIAARALVTMTAPEEILVALFVAILRCQGWQVRFVRLLDVLALEPWRRSEKPIR
jgi:hypothetical protein